MKTLVGICMFLLLLSESIFSQEKLITQSSPQTKNFLQKTGGFVWNGINPVTKNANGKTDVAMTIMLSLNLSLQSADYGLTKYALRRGAREGNPIMKPLLKREPLGMATKALAVVAQNNLLKAVFSEDKKLGYLMTGLSIGAMGLVVNHNFQILISF